MIRRQLTLSVFILSLVAALITPAAFAVPTGPVIGKVTLVLGQVTGTDQDGDTFEVKRGSDLYAGYSFDTAGRSLVRAEMNDGTRMTVSQNSSATLDEFSFDETASTGSFNTTVRKGGFQYVSGKLGKFGSARTHSRISTPSGVIGVRGATIEAVQNTDGSFSFSVPEGVIDILGPTGNVISTLSVDSGAPIATIDSKGNVKVLQTLTPALEAALGQLRALAVEAQVEADAADSAASSDGNDETGQKEEPKLEKVAGEETAVQPEPISLDVDVTQTESKPSGSGDSPQEIIDIIASPSTTR